MKKIMIFGKNFTIIEQESDKDLVEIKNKKIIVNSHNKPSTLLLNEFLENLLYSQLDEIYHQIKKHERIEVFGNLVFEVVEKIDNKKQRIAKLKGNKILVKLSAIALPKSALKYIIAHEMAHTFIKRHTKRFWKTVELMCPNFKKSKELLVEYGNHIIRSMEFNVRSEKFKKIPLKKQRKGEKLGCHRLSSKF